VITIASGQIWTRSANVRRLRTLLRWTLCQNALQGPACYVSTDAPCRTLPVDSHRRVDCYHRTAIRRLMGLSCAQASHRPVAADAFGRCQSHQRFEDIRRADFDRGNWPVADGPFRLAPINRASGVCRATPRPHPKPIAVLHRRSTTSIGRGPFAVADSQTQRATERRSPPRNHVFSIALHTRRNGSSFIPPEETDPPLVERIFLNHSSSVLMLYPTLSRYVRRSIGGQICSTLVVHKSTPPCRATAHGGTSRRKSRRNRSSGITDSIKVR